MSPLALRLAPDRLLTAFPRSPLQAKLSGLLAKVSEAAETEVNALSDDLRTLSLSMWENPELGFREFKTHDLFVSYFSDHLAAEGWTVTPHAYGLKTAFECKYEFIPASFTGRKDLVRTLGFQSELDGLPAIGQGCGHNLIAISGVAAAVGLARACRANEVPIRIVLLGTPAEEGGGGKIKLLDAGAYAPIDVCLMCHPAPINGVSGSTAVQTIRVHYKGKTAHAGAAPWLGVNALDAAVLAYNNVSAMRQQLPTTARVHGIIEGENMAPNIIPDNVRLRYNVRGPTVSDVQANLDKIIPCFEAAASATGCEIRMETVRVSRRVLRRHDMRDEREHAH